MRAFISALLAVAIMAADEADPDARAKPGGLYDYREGGRDWNLIPASELKGAENQCEQTMFRVQSPINLFTKDPAGKGEPKTLFKDQDMSLIIPKMGVDKLEKIDLNAANFPVNLGYEFGTWVDPALPFKRTDATNETRYFTPLQIHWHAPSEHTVDGKYYDAEAHIVHSKEDGSLAVLGIFFEVPAFSLDKDLTENESAGENAFVKNYLSAYDKRNEDEAKKGSIDMSQLVSELKANVDNATKDEDKSFFMYEGSLTTPPCSQGVAWTVMKSPLSISYEQLEEIATYTKGNFKQPDAGLLNIQAEYAKYLEFNLVNCEYKIHSLSETQLRDELMTALDQNADDDLQSIYDAYKKATDAIETYANKTENSNLDQWQAVMLWKAAIDQTYEQNQSKIETYYEKNPDKLKKFTEKVALAAEKMQARCNQGLDAPFEDAQDANGQPIQNSLSGSTSGGNNRRIQDLGDRKLFMFETGKNEQENYLSGSSGASALMASFAVIAAAAALSF